MTSFVLQARKNGSEEQELAVLKDKLASIEDKKNLEIVRLKSKVLDVAGRLVKEDSSIESLRHLFRLRKGVEDDHTVLANVNLISGI